MTNSVDEQHSLIETLMEELEETQDELHETKEELKEARDRITKLEANKWNFFKQQISFVNVTTHVCRMSITEIRFFATLQFNWKYSLKLKFF